MSSKKRIKQKTKRRKRYWRKYCQQKYDRIIRYNFINPQGPIRVGCQVEYINIENDNLHKVSGTVIEEKYTDITNKHIFTIETLGGDKFTVKGSNLYPYLILHEPGSESRKQSYENKQAVGSVIDTLFKGD